jgi:hypothetical protein
MARPSPERIPYLVPWTRVASNGAVTTGTFDSGAVNQTYKTNRTWTGSVTPGYMSKSRREKKKLTVLAHTMTLNKDAGLAYREILTYRNFPGGPLFVSTYNISNAVVLASFPGLAHLDSAYTAARARLADKMSDLSLNVAQAFGERRQTSKLLVDTAQRIVVAARALKQGRLGDLTTALSSSGKTFGVSPKQWERYMKTEANKRIANHWLELQYGWKPLLQDAFGAAELLSRHISADRWVHRSDAHATKSQHAYSKSSSFPFAEVLTRWTTKTKMASCYRMDSESRVGLQATGISNPALLAWELLPYSFVVDWFLPVGNYLQALNAFSGFEFVQGWISSKTIWQQQVSVNAARTYNSGLNTESYSYLYSTDRVKYDRNPINSFPAVGRLQFKNPIGGEPVARLFTAVALMRVLFK